ncbi:MAG: hypothetical protein ABN482_06325 [Corticimicrobacter sp.]|uniref:hypothetical protein n=1 Tax=Corticimicrobacter sp. TaxID=2678536 RepID=UPI0032DB886A
MNRQLYSGLIHTWYIDESGSRNEWTYIVHKCILHSDIIIIEFTGSKDGYKFSGGMHAKRDKPGVYLGNGGYLDDVPRQDQFDRLIFVEITAEKIDTDLVIEGYWRQDNQDGKGSFDYQMEGSLSLSHPS